MKLRWILAALLPAALLAAGASAQTVTQVELSRDVIQTERKAIVAANLTLSDSEAEAFWPLYNKYQDDIREVNDRRGRLIEDFLSHYDAMTEEQARATIDEFLSIEKRRLDVKQSHAKKFRKVLGARTALRFFQIDNKLDSIVDYDLARAIPLAR
jgi:hypothetical protein